MVREIPIALLLASGVIACGCTNGPPATTDEETSVQRDKELERRQEAQQPGETKAPEPAREESAAPVVGEVPQSLLASMREDLAEKLNIAADRVDVVSSEALTWKDGSLGCPRPGEMYTQALVPGYRVILEHAGRQYDYHATERGYFFLCDSPAQFEPPAASE